MVLRICDDMLDKLPNDYIEYEVKQRLQKMGPLQPMNIFLRQEIDRMQRVIATVRSTLLDLKLAIDGTIIMSENLRDALDSMYDARIPKVWAKVCMFTFITQLRSMGIVSCLSASFEKGEQLLSLCLVPLVSILKGKNLLLRKQILSF